MDYAIGIDIGSTCAKTAVLAADGSFALLSARPTGWSSVDTAESIRAELEAAHFSPETYPCVATGYGRVAVPYAGKSVTEITCHARGACFLHGRDDLLVIDIGGQDTKVIGVSGGAVQDFLMNDKCSAGTGRFLEMMARTLELDMAEMSRRGLTWDKELTISSMCTVFAESEVISLIADNHTDSDIIHGLNKSIAGKTAAMAARAKGQPPYMMTGGVARNRGVVQALEEKLGAKLLISENPDLCGALGAALFALHGD